MADFELNYSIIEWYISEMKPTVSVPKLSFLRLNSFTREIKKVKKKHFQCFSEFVRLMKHFKSSYTNARKENSNQVQF